MIQKAPLMKLRPILSVVVIAGLISTPAFADHGHNHDGASESVPHADGHAQDAHAGHGSGEHLSQEGLSDLEAIRTMQKAMFDTPDNPLDMGPVVISGEYAVSDWAQGEMAGRALLRKTEKGWAIHLCAGAGLKDAAELTKIGVPEDVAADLAAQLTAAEADLSAEKVARYDSFDGTMMVDENLI